MKAATTYATAELIRTDGFSAFISVPTPFESQIALNLPVPDRRHKGKVSIACKSRRITFYLDGQHEDGLFATYREL